MPKASSASTWGGLVKKILTTGLGAFAMTEEGIRSLLPEMKLPKEAARFLTEAAENRKRELLDLVRNEIHLFLRTLNLTGEIRKALSGLELRIQAKIKFKAPHRPPAIKIHEVKGRES